MTAPDELWVVLKDGAEPMPGVYSSMRAAAKDAATYERGDDRCGAWYEETRYVLAEKSIRAPDSAPNGLADGIAKLVDDALFDDPQAGRIVIAMETAKSILTALRNQPGGAVPKEPVVCEFCGCRNFSALARSCCLRGKGVDAATKAGEGET